MFTTHLKKVCGYRKWYKQAKSVVMEIDITGHKRHSIFGLILGSGFS
jgi:hypothetical protein